MGLVGLLPETNGRVRHLIMQIHDWMEFAPVIGDVMKHFVVNKLR
jgi:hypothetical protein